MEINRKPLKETSAENSQPASSSSNPTTDEKSTEKSAAAK